VSRSKSHCCWLLQFSIQLLASCLGLGAGAPAPFCGQRTTEASGTKPQALPRPCACTPDHAPLSPAVSG
jgi:hypothetical protein